MKARISPFTNKERKAMEQEINKQTARNVQDLSKNLQAIILWELHEQLGFGKKRLLRFQKAFAPLIKALKEFYEFKTADDMEFLYKYKLRTEVGIDVDELDDIFEFTVVMKE